MTDQVTLFDKHMSAVNRDKRQKQLIAQHALPLITLTTYLPEHMARSVYADKLFELALQAVQKQLATENGEIVKRSIASRNTGYEAIFVVSGLAPYTLKRSMVQLENSFSLGALINADVMDNTGKTISRKPCEMPPRQCIFCNNAASYCASLHAHSNTELERKVLEMLEGYMNEVVDEPL